MGSEKPSLDNINLHVKHAQMVMVIGHVGCGKSSLAMAALGEMPIVSGKRSLKGSVAYVPQEAWIVNASVKDNVPFLALRMLTSFDTFWYSV